MAIPKKKTVTKKPATKKIAKSKKTAHPKPESSELELAAAPEAEVPKVADPIGDETDGEANIDVERDAEKLENESALDQDRILQAAGKQKTESALYQGTTLQAAETQETESALDQGTTLQAAETQETESALYQGTTSVVPKAQQKKDRALAPEGGEGFNPRKKPKKSARAGRDGFQPIHLSPEASLDTDAAPESEAAPGTEPESQPRPPAKLERLQKILAAAGVASRRSAEAMIEQGRVQVNGKVVTVLGTKADAARDHIRVDGKLLQGPERHRYFVLNKPRGFVTTVKDPEGRPTVMQFFSKFNERLYPVGRLDYMSEGLLVVTNDGELANRLTKASSGVEKTYLVKVAGQPTEAELNILRGGVSIERGKPGSPPVRTSPARVRQVRQGDNPWYEVVLIEGRNRELRKMFEEIGHFVEKIRRVGYGPLVLDQEPGSLRELQPAELDALRQVAEGTLRTPKSKDLRRRNLLDAGLLPTVLPKPSGRPRITLPPSERPAVEARPAFRPRKFGPDHASRPTRPTDSFASGEANKLFRPTRPAGSFDKNAAKPFRPDHSSGEDRTFSAKPAWKKPERPARSTSEGFRPAAGRSFDRPLARPDSRPAWKKDDRPARPPARFPAGSTGESRPAAARPFTAKPAWKKPERSAPSSSVPDRSGPARPASRTASRPAWKKDDRPARPVYKRPDTPRRVTPVREASVFDEDLGPVRPPNLHIEEITGPDRPFSTSGSKPRAGGARPSAPRLYSDRSRPSSPRFERPASSTRPDAKPFRGHGNSTRPFTTSSGKPRAGGARPSSKPFKSGPRAGSDSRPSYGPKRPYGAKPSSRSFAAPSRPFTPRTDGASDYRPTQAKPYPNSTSRAERKAGPGWKPKSGATADRSSSVGWKPKTRYGPGKPASGSRSKPKPGSSAKPSHRVKPGGKKRS
jgi:23S rRNA pseudouridine2605 synthase